MTIEKKQNIFIIIIVSIALLTTAWFGYRGFRTGQSDTVLKNAESISTVLKYFYDDQGRYPSTQEFSNTDIMNGYFNVFPLPIVAGGKCQKDYEYISSGGTNYELKFCLPIDYKNFASGWNSVKNK